MGRTRFFFFIFFFFVGGGGGIKGHNMKTKKGELSFMCATICLNLIHIPTKLHEAITNSK